MGAKKVNYEKLAHVLRNRARQIIDRDDVGDDQRDDAELLNVLARMVEGKSVYQAFGAPGDWGYSTVIGATLAEAYRQAN